MASTKPFDNNQGDRNTFGGGPESQGQTYPRPQEGLSVGGGYNHPGYQGGNGNMGQNRQGQPQQQGNQGPQGHGYKTHGY